MRRLILVTSIFIGGIIASFGCGGSATPVSEGTAPISIETLEGEIVGTDSTFQYGFDSGVDTNTVSVTNFFIMLTSSGECNSANALYQETAKVTCDGYTCTLDTNPDAETKLSGGTKYTFCITSDIVGVDTTLSFSFTTEGEAPSTLSVSSVVDAASTPNTVNATGSTGIIPTSFTITFSEEPSSTDGISLACGDLSPSVDVSCSGSTCTAEVAEAWRYAMMECTLTIGTETGLSTAATYTFTNACALNDDFNAASISDEASSCWLISSNSAYTTWAAMDGILSFDTANSTLDADFTGVADNPIELFYKTVTIAADEFEIEVYFKSASGITNWPRSQVFVGIRASTDFENDPDGYYIGLIGYDTNQYCAALAGVDGDLAAAFASDCNEDQGYYLKLTKSGSTVTRQYKAEGGEYQDIANPEEQTWPDIDFSGENRAFGLSYAHGAGLSEKSALDYIYSIGFTVTGQY